MRALSSISLRHLAVRQCDSKKGLGLGLQSRLEKRLWLGLEYFETFFLYTSREDNAREEFDAFFKCFQA